MTAQISDSILFEGAQYALLATPLSAYFNRAGLQLGLEPIGTCCWRGYVARWEIIDRRLYLVDVNGNLPHGKLTMHHLFPAFPERVFAHWYYGELRLPHGDRLSLAHSGFGGRYEREWVLEIERGVITGRRLQENLPEPEDDGQAGRRPGLARRLKAWWMLPG